MNKTYLVALTTALTIAFPLALAHDPAGTPRNYCEDPAEWGSHDYGPPGTGFVIFLGQDGNLAGDCNGDTVPADYDGHIEFAFGGGWLSAISGDGVTSGSIVCFGEVGHHAEFGPFSVEDVVLGSAQPFSVAADFISLVPPTDPAAPNCGDFESDDSTDCVGTCTVTFPAGLDGTYQVYVGAALGGTPGTLGHIITDASAPAIPCGPSTVFFQNGLAASILTVTTGAGRSIRPASFANPSTATDIGPVTTSLGFSGTFTWVIVGAGNHTWKIETVCNAPFSGANEVFGGAFSHVA